MKITVYGNNASYPAANGACSCYLLEIDGRKILIDMGNGSLTKLQQKIELSEVNLIIISHLHFDHFGDLFCAKYQLETRKAYGVPIGRIPLYIPALPAWAYQELSSNDVFEIVSIRDGMNIVLFNGLVNASFIAVRHLVESYGMRFKNCFKTFAYTGDSGLCPQLVTIAREADLFLCEATYPTNDLSEESHHLSAKSAAEISLKANVKNLVLTHYHPSEKSDIYNAAKGIFVNTTLSEILHSYEI